MALAHLETERLPTRAMYKPEEGERTSIRQPMRVHPSRWEWTIGLEALFAQLDLEPLGEQNPELRLKLLLRVRRAVRRRAMRDVDLLPLRSDGPAARGEHVRCPVDLREPVAEAHPLVLPADGDADVVAGVLELGVALAVAPEEDGPTVALLARRAGTTRGLSQMNP